MRALAVAVVLALPLFSCASAGPEPARERPVSYNRRELPPTPGLFSGPDGVFTIYQSGGERAAPPVAPEPAAEPERSKRREILMCDSGRDCEQPDEAR